LQITTPHGIKTIKLNNTMSNETVLKINGEGIRGVINGDLYLKLKIKNPHKLNEEQKIKMQ
jgi:DnaJ-class molecular chaperone